MLDEEMNLVCFVNTILYFNRRWFSIQELHEHHIFWWARTKQFNLLAVHFLLKGFSQMTSKNTWVGVTLTSICEKKTTIASLATKFSLSYRLKFHFLSGWDDFLLKMHSKVFRSVKFYSILTTNLWSTILISLYLSILSIQKLFSR